MSIFEVGNKQGKSEQIEKCGLQIKRQNDA
jgi:hypothetical protein